MSLLLLTYNFMHFLWILLLLQQMFCKPILKVFFFLYSFLFFASVLFLHVCLQPQARCAEET